MNYTQEQLQEALNDFNHFINMLTDTSQGAPERLLIARDLIKKEIQDETRTT